VRNSYPRPSNLEPRMAFWVDHRSQRPKEGSRMFKNDDLNKLVFTELILSIDESNCSGKLYLKFDRLQDKRT
jgi:hypothetical protein